MKLTRRRLMILGSVGAIGAASALDTDGESGTLWGGKMALGEAFKIADGLWIGPTSARGTVPEESGNVYMSSDEDVDFFYDGDAWQTRSIGSSTTPVPSVTTDDLVNVADVVIHSGDDPQTRIDNADPYDTVVAHPNTEFTLSSRLEVTTDGLRIFGLKLKTGDGMDDVALWVHNCSYVRVENCHIDGNKANQTGATDEVNGIEVSDASNIWVVNNDVINTQGDGIVATARTADSAKANGAISNIHIRENTLSGIGHGDIFLQGGGGLSAERGWVVDNEIVSTTQDIINISDGFQHAVVRGNYVTGSGVGLALEQHTGRGVDRALLDVTISENTFDVSSHGIEIQYTADTFRDITISNNTFIGPDTGGVNGIRTNGTGQDIAGLTIEDNKFTDWDKCIILDTDEAWGFTVTGNTFRSSEQGINATGPTRFICTDNDFIDLIDYGVNLISTTGTLSDAIIANNHGTGTGGNTMDALIWIHDTGGSFENIRINNNTIGPNVASKYTLDETMGILIDGRAPTENTGGTPTYDGDGSATQSISLGFRPSYVVIVGSDGTIYDTHDNPEFGDGYLHTDAPGATTITDAGFDVGNGSGDQDPNSDTETYDVYYEA